MLLGRLVEWKNPERALQLYNQAHSALPDKPEVSWECCREYAIVGY